MVSRRNFFAIFLMMFVVLFLCQFSQAMHENISHSDNDKYESMDIPTSSDVWVAGKPFEVPEGIDLTGADTFKKTVLFVAADGSEALNTVSAWCELTKQELEVTRKLPLYSFLDQGKEYMVLIDAASIPSIDYMPYIRNYIIRGITVVFCTLPEPDDLKEDTELRNFLGITEIPSDTVTVDGIRIFDGAFVGGEAVYKAVYPEDEKYQDLDLEMPWYITAEGSKSYIVGMMDEDEYDRERFPRIVWRYSGGNTKVFAVNGDYMKGLEGLGLLNLFVYESSDYALYPVVNAGSTVLADMPGFTDENSAALNEAYSRDGVSAARDIFLPGIISSASRNGFVPTFMMVTKYDLGSDAETDMSPLDFYLQQINEINGEAGLSLRSAPGCILEDKITYNAQALAGAGNPYRFRTLYYDSADELAESPELISGYSTVACAGADDLFSYISDDITCQMITQDAADYTYSGDFLARSLNTSVGYSSLLMDLHPTLWPESSSDYWENYFTVLDSNVSTYWSRLTLYEKTTLSESDLRVRRMLSLDYDSFAEDITNGKLITLMVSGGGEESYFLLRIHDSKISEITGGEYTRIDDDSYLICARENTVKIRITDSDDVLRYYNPFRIPRFMQDQL
ncbi:MAG: hypothetical protein J6X94_07240 [Lachnospiraceae bacterium]|nr:hypothetical protein [Lachnospiraceae bacterium]